MKKPATLNQRTALIIGVLLLLALAVVLSVVLSRPAPADETAGPAGETAETAAGADRREAEDGQAAPAAARAMYVIEYDVPWSVVTHPATLPDGPHVSPIVIVAHAEEGDLFASGTTATDGIKMMAETGATEVLADEIVGNPSILGFVRGVRIDTPGSSVLELEFSQEHPLLSAVSMLAPSPDWFVAVDNVRLFENGEWLEEIELTMRPYDAGTDSGATFTADDLETAPAATIGPPADKAFADAAAEGDFATIKISRRD